MIHHMVRCLIALALSALAVTASAGDRIEVLWLGQSATRITSLEGKVILIDPYLTKNPKTPAKWKNLDELGKVDLILITHAHGDHLGDAPEIARKLKVPMVAPPGLSQSLQALGILSPELMPRMNKGGTIMPLGDKIRITMVRAEHSSELVWKNPASGKDEVHVGGEPVGFIIELENGFRIYHMGDTGLFGDMKLIGEHYRPDLILIPIGGHFVMNPADAAYATSNWLKPRHAIPIHYGTNPALKGTPTEYVSALGKTSVKVHALQPGDAINF
ncbi:MAG: metal-dependent hydrolase [Sulfuritalea sp.]|jgi:L-ascorbate metabolism protein UlaG (beta-lactamase superfamily)|nr:metal-dependent hydrolase [Sulfuritalea sp.]